MIKHLAELLKEEINKGLPGTEVQWQMASSDRLTKNFPREPATDARKAGVLLLLYPVNGSVFTVFMQRPSYEGIHSGQISFPGGRYEKEDRDIIETALREAGEETGADMSKIIVINTLTPLFIPVSNTIVTPVLAWTKEKPEFTPQAEEVDYLFDAEINRFFDPTIIKTKASKIKGELIDVKYFDYEGKVIWGATAMILNELLALIKRVSNYHPG